MDSSRPQIRMTPEQLRQRMIEMEIESYPPLDQSYRCYSAKRAQHQAAALEAGDKIIMPPSALQVLSTFDLPIMLFQIRNPKKAAAERVSHCGVLDFNAEEGTIYMASWKMRSLQLKEEDVVHVKIVSLPKGRFVKFQPHTTSFLDISNPRAVLEKTLRTFTCFTTGDTILLPYNGKEYYVDIIQTEPPEAISIVDTDCEVDFAAPLDYKEPENPLAATSKAELLASPDQVEEPKFSPFTGAGRRLDGKAPFPAPPVFCSSSFVAAASTNNGKGDASSSQGSNGRAKGKLVFGTNIAAAADRTTSSTIQKETEKKASKEEAKPEIKEEPKFQPFSGKGYSLRG